ncbi:AraC family transcriptional regulator [Pseudomonas sp. ZM23]|uniref:AraC family transcriptional regulator ligand-binding domain-containing protein n=1 Tax=Pseudomonas triclosanedens TaxID=2961893 RepID=A0ABY6ZUT9_9PSED|nr:AraC family transcriptional regulator [Pseudomonas triclosanedens]MCP8466529.1 AraC family transcriptional regulator [Pseudomonas triclosanedens]MCP8472116.1 AraC family transcriptional regulator [Pseudomonas triclosanedens]MCP8474500.1 AraC family transcriptional regulator [Pseudomonas triclosanedens]WAI48116.1 AraC family transcriptional regulator ligand-binding domain-containing protein [Pseudomonas triclosanedens]
MDWRQVREVTGVRYLLETASDAGLTPEECLVGSAIAVADLQSRTLRIQAWQELAVIRNVLQRIGGPGLGLAAGQRYHLTSLGHLGFTMLASRTLQEAFETFGRFQSLALTLCPVSSEAEPRGVWLIYDDTVLPEDARPFVVERGIAGCLQLSRELLQRPVRPLAIELKATAPDGVEAFRELFAQVPRFAAPRNAMLFATDDLLAALPQAHISARDSGEQLCEQLCNELSLTLAATPTARLVQQLLLREPASLLGASTVAGRLGLSERTLQRRLAEEGQSMQALNDGIRQRLAERLLRESRMDLHEVAQCLGYAEAASFSRAFQRWTGQSPGRWKRHAGSLPAN